MLDDQINDAFKTTDMQAALEPLLARTWNKNSQSGLALSKIDLAEIENARTASTTLINSYFDRTIQTALVRKANLERFAGSRFVSIGEDCFSRTLLTRWGFKPPAKLGEKSGPFDLAIHPLSSIINLLKNNFEDYLTTHHLRYDNERQVVLNDKYGVLFNHEVGSEWANDEFSKLRETYYRRIENFSKSFDSLCPTNFVLHLRYPSSKQLISILELASELRTSSVENKIICIATWAHGSNIDVSGREDLRGRGIFFIDAHYPFEKYVWYNELHASSEKGYLFEKDIIDQIDRIISNTSENDHRNPQ